jgi:ribosomal protein S18 acetylase RimI-like enzyme
MRVFTDDKNEENVTDAIWLCRRNYQVIPLNPRLQPHILELECAIQRGISVRRDSQRDDFYILERRSGWVYIHVRENSKIVYLIAHSSSNHPYTAAARTGSQIMEEDTAVRIPGEKSHAVGVRHSDSNWLSKLSRVVRMDMSQVEFLGLTLSRAFQNEPSATYVLPDQAARSTVLPRFFKSVAIRTSQLCGEIYTTQDVTGGALWISPGYASSFGRVLKTGVMAMGLKFGRSTLKRWVNLSAHMQWVHRRLLAEPHWYLMSLAVERSDAGRLIAGALIQPVLSQADSDRLPCYVETFRERDLSFYEEHGFRIFGVGRVPSDGPVFWSMMRAPQ